MRRRLIVTFATAILLVVVLVGLWISYVLLNAHADEGSSYELRQAMTGRASIPCVADAVAGVPRLQFNRAAVSTVRLGADWPPDSGGGLVWFRWNWPDRRFGMVHGEVRHARDTAGVAELAVHAFWIGPPRPAAQEVQLVMLLQTVLDTAARNCGLQPRGPLRCNSQGDQPRACASA